MSLSGRTPVCPRQRGRTLFPSARGAYQPTRSSNGAISRRDGGRELACPVLIARVGQEPCVGPPATPPISPTQPSDGGPAGRAPRHFAAAFAALADLPFNSITIRSR